MYYSLRIIAGTADSFSAAAADYCFSRRATGRNRDGDDSEEATAISDHEKLFFRRENLRLSINKNTWS